MKKGEIVRPAYHSSGGRSHVWNKRERAKATTSQYSAEFTAHE